MPRDGELIKSIEMRSLILEALSIEDKERTPRKQTFKMYEYNGCSSDLRAIVEHLAIEHGLIDKVVEIPNSAWGAPGEMPHYQRNTNFDYDELDIFSEELHFLIHQNVISPGATRGYGDTLPYFHVTKYGLSCLAQQEVLPYDPEKYLAKLKATASVDDWEFFYIEQSLLCYNVGANESSIIMLGLAGEYLASKLISSMTGFLQKFEPSLHSHFVSALQGKTAISQRYQEYETILRTTTNSKDAAGAFKYPTLQTLKPLLDIPAKSVYATFLRLTRNELAHPTDVKIEHIECLTMLVTYIKYCETQHKFLDFFISNS